MTTAVRRFDHPTLPYRYAKRSFNERVALDIGRYGLGAGSIGLVSCSEQKLACRAPARELYHSTLFRKSARTCEATCHDWAILSAKHGLVLPDQIIDPYDVSMRDLSRDEKAAWRFNVRNQIIQRWGSRRRLVLYAGKSYEIPSRDLSLSRPLARMSIGNRLQFLTTDIPAAMDRAINGSHAWTFHRGNGEELPGSAVNMPTAAAALEDYLKFHPDQDKFPWILFTTRDMPSRKEITTRYVVTNDDPIMFQRRVFSKATGLTLPTEPEWLTSVTPELERT